jgi:hypothetical protein
MYGVVLDRAFEGSGVRRTGRVDFEDEGDEYVRRRYFPTAFCFCSSCSVDRAELAVPSPLHAAKVEDEKRKDAEWQELVRSARETSGPTEEELAEEQRAKAAEAQAEEREVKESLAAGDVVPFEKSMPTSPNADDAMSGAVPAWKIDRRAKQASDNEVPGHSSRPTFDDLAGRGGNPAMTDTTGAQGEQAQRAALLEYLKSPRSRQRFNEERRKALRLWAEGKSQVEVQRATGFDQGNFSKLKKKALGHAHSGT